MPIIARCKICKQRIADYKKGSSKLCALHINYYEMPSRKEKAKHYGHKWRKTRLVLLGQYPTCALCLVVDNVVKSADMVDHIQPLNASSQHDQVHSLSNLAGLCWKHHSQKTNQVDRPYWKGDLKPLERYKKLINQAKRSGLSEGK